MAMQNRGPLPSEHRRRISNAMRDRYAANPSIRQAGRQKQCSLCGEKGHNKKGCPLVIGKNSKEEEKEYHQEMEQQGAEEDRRVQRNALDDQNSKLSMLLDTLQQDSNLAKRKTRKRTCRICGGEGHNVRTCPVVESRMNSNDQRSVNVTPSDTENTEITAVTKKFITIEEVYNIDEGVGEDGTKEAQQGKRTQQDDGTMLLPRTMPSSSSTTTTMSGSDRDDNSMHDQSKAGDDSNRNDADDAINTAAVESYTAAAPGTSNIALDDGTSTTNVQSASAAAVRPLPGSIFALSKDGSIVFPLPTTQEQCVQQASLAVLRAWDDGIRRQALELLLPQKNSVSDGGWPGGIRQQFRAALPMMETLLLQLKKAPGLEGRITAELLDEGDCVGAWQSEKLAAVIFPTADTLSAVRRLDDGLSGKRLLLVINSQWQIAGQIVSDFGFGSSRRSAERFVSSLEDVYYLKRVRVLGDEVRVLRCYPGRWQVHFIRSAGESELLSLEDDRPTYQRLLELLKEVRGSLASKSWLDRVLSMGYFDNTSSYSGEDSEGPVVEEEEGVVERDIVTGEVVVRQTE